MGCSISDSLTKQIEKSDQENSTKSVSINYYSDKTVKSLEIPPDLTKPNAQNSFRISEFYSGIDEKVIDFSDSQSSIDKKTKVLAKFDDIEVSRSGKRRWLIINKNSDLVWDIAKDFFKQKGFTIKKSNSDSTVIWTPWDKIANQMADMGKKDEWRRMVCVETANLLENSVVIYPDVSHSIATEYSVQEF